MAAAPLWPLPSGPSADGPTGSSTMESSSKSASHSSRLPALTASSEALARSVAVLVIISWLLRLRPLPPSLAHSPVNVLRRQASHQPASSRQPESVGLDHERSL